MYELFFGLSRRPFAATPDAECCAAVPTMQAAFEDLQRCLTRGDGVGILTGGAGCGKTLLCQKLVAELGEAFRPVYLANSNFPTQRSLLQAILYGLGRPYLRMDEQELRLELTTIVHEVASQANGVLLIVDEAHLLDEELLEEIRTATNLIHRGVPLVRVMLAGQFELEEKLASPALQSLNQRVGVHATLEPISQQESVEYIGYRLQWAGGSIRTTFSPDAARMIAQASDGNARCLNQLADHSLLLAYAAEERPVQAATVRQALEDLRHLPLQWNISESQLSSAKPDDVYELELPVKRAEVEPEQVFSTSHEPHQASVIEFGNASVIEIGGSEPQPAPSAIEIGGGEIFEATPTALDSAAPEAITEGPSRVEFVASEDKPRGRGPRLQKKVGDKSLEIFAVSAIPTGRSVLIDPVGIGGEFEKRGEPVVVKAPAQNEEIVVDRYAKLDSEISRRPKAAPKPPTKNNPPVSTQADKPPRVEKRPVEPVENEEYTAHPSHDELIASIERYMAELVRDRPSSTIQSANKVVDDLLTSIAPNIFSSGAGAQQSALPIEYDVIQPEGPETQHGKPPAAKTGDDHSSQVKSTAKKDERYARLFNDLRARRLG